MNLNLHSYELQLTAGVVLVSAIIFIVLLVYSKRTRAPLQKQLQRAQEIKDGADVITKRGHL